MCGFPSSRPNVRISVWVFLAVFEHSTCSKWLVFHFQAESLKYGCQTPLQWNLLKLLELWLFLFCFRCLSGLYTWCHQFSWTHLFGIPLTYHIDAGFRKVWQMYHSIIMSQLSRLKVLFPKPVLCNIWHNYFDAIAETLFYDWLSYHQPPQQQRQEKEKKEQSETITTLKSFEMVDFSSLH